MCRTRHDMRCPNAPPEPLFVNRFLRPLGAHRRSSVVLAIAGVTFCLGCQRRTPDSVAQAPQEPQVQNAFTDYVDRGVHTMEKAEKAAETANARNAELQRQSESIQEP